MPEILRGDRPAEALIGALAATAERLQALVQDVDDVRLDAAPEGEWPARTVLAHLRDDEFLVCRLRLERMLVEDHPALAPFDEQAWAARRWRGRDAPAQLLEDFRIQRAASLAILARLEDEEWRRPGTQPEIGTFDVRWWVQHWAEHDATHLAQIERALAR